MARAPKPPALFPADSSRSEKRGASLETRRAHHIRGHCPHPSNHFGTEDPPTVSVVAGNIHGFFSYGNLGDKTEIFDDHCKRDLHIGMLHLRAKIR
jgi:hypothetical protein